MRRIEQLVNGETAIVLETIECEMFLSLLGLTPNITITKIVNNVYRFRGATVYLRPGHFQIFITEKIK